MRHAREQVVGRPLAVVLCLLTVFGPISMDLYLATIRGRTPDIVAPAQALRVSTPCSRQMD